jgi:hypothetical protein
MPPAREHEPATAAASAPEARAGEPPIAAEARRILAAADAGGVPVRLVGGLAVRLHAEPLHPAFAREYKDIDLVTVRDRGRDAGALLEALGYVGADEFNALNGHRRLMYGDEETGRRLDVFVGEFRMCHRIPVAERIERDPTTVPLAELLLTKLQIVELNERDAIDAAALLHHHDVADHDDDAVNADRIAALCAADWGLWRTATMNLERVAARTEDLALAAGERDAICARIARLRNRVDAEPKSRAWRLRDRVGDRKRWYDLPEEVESA